MKDGLSLSMIESYEMCSLRVEGYTVLCVESGKSLSTVKSDIGVECAIDICTPMDREG